MNDIRSVREGLDVNVGQRQALLGLRSTSTNVSLESTAWACKEIGGRGASTSLLLLLKLSRQFFIALDLILDIRAGLVEVVRWLALFDGFLHTDDVAFTEPKRSHTSVGKVTENRLVNLVSLKG